MVCPAKFRFWLLAFAGAFFHALLLCAPVVLLDGKFPALSQGNIAVFLGIATLWCLIESAVSHAEPRLPVEPTGQNWVPLAVGMFQPSLSRAETNSTHWNAAMAS